MKQTSQAVNPPPLNIVKNSINLINPTFCSKQGEQNLEWTKGLFIPSSIKGKKTISKFKGSINTQRNSLDRISYNVADKRRGSNTKRAQVDKIVPLIKPIVKKYGKNNSRTRKSVDTIFANKQNFPNGIEIEDDTPAKVKLYYNTK